MQRILVVGCGYVGAPLAASLAAEGRQVWGLRRSPGPLPEGVAPLPGDVTRPESLHTVPPHLDGVVFCASRGGAGSGQSHEAVFVEGQRNVVEAIRRSSRDLRRYLFVSSTGVYGDRQGGWVTETTPAEPGTETGRCMLTAESVARTAPGSIAILRFAGIYGPDRSRLVRGVSDGSLRLPADGGDWLNQIHRDDCVGAIRHLLLNELPEPLYLGCDEQPARRGEVLAWLAEKMGVVLAREAPDAPVASRRRARGEKRVDSQRLRASGYTFRYPTYRQGYAQVLASGEGA